MEVADSDYCYSYLDLENRDLTLDWTDDDETILSCLQNIRRALQQGEIEKDMNTLELSSLENTPEISLAIVDMFQQCSSKGVKWDRLIIDGNFNPSPYLCSLLSEAQNLGMFQDVVIRGTAGLGVYLDEDLAVVFRDFMQATNRRLERLAICDVSVTSRVASILFHGLKSNATILKFKLENVDLQFEDRIRGWQDAVPEFAEALLRNRSLVELNLFRCTLSDNGLSIIIQSLHDHPTLMKLSLGMNHGRDASLRALGGFLSSPTCTLSSLDFADQFKLDSSGSLNIAILVQEIDQNNSLERLDLDYNHLSNDDLVALFGLLPKCPGLTTIDVGHNGISNLTLPAVNEESSRLRKLILRGNPIFEMQAIMTDRLCYDCLVHIRSWGVWVMAGVLKRHCILPKLITCWT
jgi:hypothetical protein